MSKKKYKKPDNINKNLPKNEREGQIGINNQRLEMKITRYSKLEGEKYYTIDVEFLIDGYKVYDKQYYNFLTGRIQNPNFPDSKHIDKTGERRQNNQGDWATIIRHGKLKNQKYITIDIKFDDGIILYNKKYQNFKNGQIKHPIRYEETIAYHIECELGLNLYDIINMKKCRELGLDPYEISKCSHIKLWFLCQKVDYHNDFDGYEIECKRFTLANHRCPYCKKDIKVHWRDSVAYNYPEIAKMIAIPENNLTFEDCYNIACNSGKMYFVKCKDCRKVSTKKIRLVDLTVINRHRCEFCSCGISVPEKFFANILYQLKEQNQIDEFKTQLQSNIFKWINNFKYDFYTIKDNTSYIFETHGKQHYKESNMTSRTLEEEQENDKNKRELALNNNIDIYKEIDCRYSEFEWLKENIEKELKDLFDLDNIDWMLAWRESQISKCSKTWDLWNSGLYSTSEIGNILNLHQDTIVRYIKRGCKLGLCNYDSRKIRSESLKDKGVKPVICITTKRMFKSMKEAGLFYNIKSIGRISKSCKDNRKSCGKFNNMKLKWKFINYKHDKILRYNK